MSNIKFIITLDADDPTVTDELKTQLTGIHPNIILNIGFSTGKISAINRDMPDASTFDIVLLASDDMVPEVIGYDNIIRNKMREYYPDTDGVLFFNDGHHQNRLNTLLICGSRYYQRFGYLYYPEYKSLFCDNEFMIVANQLKRQTYIDKVIIRHQHPNIVNTVTTDELNIQNDKYYFQDEALFNKRMKRFITGSKLNIPKVAIRLSR